MPETTGAGRAADIARISAATASPEQGGWRESSLPSLVSQTRRLLLPGFHLRGELKGHKNTIWHHRLSEGSEVRDIHFLGTRDAIIFAASSSVYAGKPGTEDARRVFECPGGTVTALSAAESGQIVAVASKDGENKNTLHLLFVRGFAGACEAIEIASAPINEEISDISVSKDGMVIAVSSAQGSIFSFHLSESDGGFSLSLLSRWSLGTPVESVALNHAGDAVIAGTNDSKVYTVRIDPANLIIPAESAAGGSVASIDISRNTSLIPVAEQSGNIDILEIDDAQERSGLRKVKSVPLEGISVVAMNPDGSHVSGGTKQNEARILNVEEDRVTQQAVFSADSPVSALTFNADGTLLAIGTSNGEISVLDGWKEGHFFSSEYEARGLELLRKLIDLGLEPLEVANCLTVASSDEAVRLFEEYAGESRQILRTSGDDSAEAWKAREKALADPAVDPRDIAFSMAGTRSSRKYEMLERIRTDHPDVFLWCIVALVGDDSEPAWELRESVDWGNEKDDDSTTKRSEVLRSCAGSIHEKAKKLRENAMKTRVWRYDYGVSLTGMPLDELKREVELIEKQMEREKDDAVFWRNAILLATSGRDDDWAWALRERMIEGGAYKAFLAGSLDGIDSERADSWRRRAMTEDCDTSEKRLAIAQSIFGYTITWALWRLNRFAM